MLGKTTARIAGLVGKPNSVESLSVADVKTKIKYVELPPCEEWRLGLIFEMRRVMREETLNWGLNRNEAVDIFEHACVS